MIRNLKVVDPTQAVCPWWDQVDWLKGLERLEFKPGLNLLFGPNGSGKSTVLQTIAKLLCCFDGDHQLVGQWTTPDLHTGHGEARKLKLGVKPSHDGSPVMHFDPGQTAGLLGGGFDYDFMEAGLRNTMFKGSSGQTTIMRMNAALTAALKDEWLPIEWKYGGPDRHRALAKFLKGTGKKTCPTLLMDEPSRSLDLLTEIRLFEVLQKIADKGVQVIAATHSVFALLIEGAHIIDTKGSYSGMARAEAQLALLKSLRAKPNRLESMMNFLAEQEAVDQVAEGV